MPGEQAVRPIQDRFVNQLAVHRDGAAAIRALRSGDDAFRPGNFIDARRETDVGRRHLVRMDAKLGAKPKAPRSFYIAPNSLCVVKSKSNAIDRRWQPREPRFQNQVSPYIVQLGVVPFDSRINAEINRAERDALDPGVRQFTQAKETGNRLDESNGLFCRTGANRVDGLSGFGFRQHQRANSLGWSAKRGQIIGVPRCIDAVDADDDRRPHRVVALANPAQDRFAGRVLGCGLNRILQIEDHTIRAAGESFGKTFRPVAGNEEITSLKCHFFSQFKIKRAHVVR